MSHLMVYRRSNLLQLPCKFPLCLGQESLVRTYGHRYHYKIMLDYRFIKENLAAVKQNIADRYMVADAEVSGLCGDNWRKRYGE